MNKELSIILLDKFSDATYLDRTSGLVQVFEKSYETEKGTVKKRIPVTSFASLQNCNTAQSQVDMIPNSKYKGMLYFEDGGVNSLTKVREGMTAISRLRLVCWLNTKLISGQTDMLLSAKVIGDFSRRLLGNPFNSTPFTKIAVKIIDVIQDKSVFSKYDYTEGDTQYLMAPFEYFGMDINVSYCIPFDCLESITLNTPDTCL